MKNNEIKIVEVSFNCESETSYAVLVDKGLGVGCWSRLVWFPKKLVCLTKVESKSKEFYIIPIYFLSAPLWLLEDRKVKLE